MSDALTLLMGFLVHGIIIAVLLNIKKMNSQKVKLSILSLISSIIIAVIPYLGYRLDNDFGYYYFGFPADVLVYLGGTFVTLESLGLVFNFFFFYWIFKLIYKSWTLMIPVKKEYWQGVIVAPAPLSSDYGARFTTYLEIGTSSVNNTVKFCWGYVNRKRLRAFLLKEVEVVTNGW